VTIGEVPTRAVSAEGDGPPTVLANAATLLARRTAATSSRETGAGRLVMGSLLRCE